MHSANKTKDYLKIAQTPHVVNNEPIYLSISVLTYGSIGFKKDYTIVLTDCAFYEMYKNAAKYRIPLENIDAISKTTLSSEFVIHVKNDYDLRYLSHDSRDEIIETLLHVICNIRKLCKAFPVYIVPHVSLSQVMTTSHFLQSRQEIRPPDSMRVMMNPEKYKDKEEISPVSQKRKTEVLFYQSQQIVKDISIDDFELLKVLGQGAFGKVFLAQHKETGKIYAMKVLKKNNIIAMNQLEHTKTEKMILQHVNHPFIVGLEFAFQTPAKLYFVLEFMKGGELFNHISKMNKLSESEAIFYAACAALALGHLHKNNYIYRDLKPENILLDEYGFAKLADFGLAKFLKQDEQTNTFCGTPEYLAPEVILGQGHNRLADWWALGILIYEMLVGMTPFRAANVQILYSSIIKKDLIFNDKVMISNTGKDIITKLLNKCPLKRLGANNDVDEVLSHPWFAQININELLKRKVTPPYKPLVKGNEWENNFGIVTHEKIRDSVNTVDADVLRSFQKDFEELNFNKHSQP